VLIGVISDTHGRLPARVHDVFTGVDAIVHAGDVGDERVLEELETIAPVLAVRGNDDDGDLAWRLKATEVRDYGSSRLLVGHARSTLLAAGVPSRVDIVVTGHTHRPEIESDGGVLYLNPGTAAGERRGGGHTVALLTVTDDGLQVRIVDL